MRRTLRQQLWPIFQQGVEITKLHYFQQKLLHAQFHKAYRKGNKAPCWTKPSPAKLEQRWGCHLIPGGAGSSSGFSVPFLIILPLVLNRIILNKENDTSTTVTSLRSLTQLSEQISISALCQMPAPKPSSQPCLESTSPQPTTNHSQRFPTLEELCK